VEQRSTRACLSVEEAIPGVFESLITRHWDNRLRKGNVSGIVTR